MKLFGAALALFATAVFAQTPAEVVAPNPNLLIEGIPPIPQSLAARVGGYSDFRGHSFADWHPARREMLVSHRAAGSNVNQLFLLTAPGASLERLTDFPEPISGGSFDPRGGRFVIYSRDTGGNEASRIYRLDLDIALEHAAVGSGHSQRGKLERSWHATADRFGAARSHRAGREARSDSA